MSEIDTSPAAIELIKARRAIYDRTRALADIDTLLAALAERDAKLAAREAEVAKYEKEAQGLRGMNARYSLYLSLAEDRLSSDWEGGPFDCDYEHPIHEKITDLVRSKIDFERKLAAREVDVAGYIKELVQAKQKLAAHDACLANVREERPDLQAAISDAADTVTYWDGPLADRYRLLGRSVAELQQNEARWRNARDAWEAERKRLTNDNEKLRSMYDALSLRNGEIAEQLHQRTVAHSIDKKLLEDARNAETEWHQQLSASNAAADELRKDLEHSTKVVQQYVSLWDEAERQLTASNAACAEMREALQALYSETADYITINNLGAVHWNRSMQLARDALAAQPKQQEQHADDLAVDRFAVAMKAKMAKKRAEGRGGWDDPNVCSINDLYIWLQQHLPKGDFTDIGNYAMMIWNRQQQEQGHE